MANRLGTWTSCGVGECKKPTWFCTACVSYGVMANSHIHLFSGVVCG